MENYTTVLALVLEGDKELRPGLSVYTYFLTEVSVIYFYIL